jgi:uncharacterized surface protein with fasciclin (FAS1) repeats
VSETPYLHFRPIRPFEDRGLIMVRTLLASAALAVAAPVFAQGAKPPMLGGSQMVNTDTIVANLARSKDHSTLVAAVKAAGLVDALNAAGPFTLFAPTNAAFEKLPAGTVDSLLKPENKDQLTAILTFHAISGQRLTAANLLNAAVKGGGTVQVETVQGGALTGRAEGPTSVFLVDGQGNRVNVTQADNYGSNGVIHVVDTVLLPPAN